MPILIILSLCMDHSMQTRINSLYLFLLFLFMPLSHRLLCMNCVEIRSFEFVHFQIECHLLIICKYFFVMETPQGSDWMPIMPTDSNSPRLQLAMWLGQMKIFRTMLCTLCQNCLSYSICNYVTSTALMGTVFAF